MELTVPYTFYPIALPHSIAWLLFVAALAGAGTIGALRWRRAGWRTGLRDGVLGLVALIVGTMVASMVITFAHDL